LHSAKAAKRNARQRASDKKHLAKAPLWSVFCRALGKAFAERQGGLWQRKPTVVTVIRRDAFFAERLQSGARQRAKHFFKKNYLSSASKLALSKEQNIFLKKFLCRAPPS
jgi:hypothetical protein